MSETPTILSLNFLQQNVANLTYNLTEKENFLEIYVGCVFFIKKEEFFTKTILFNNDGGSKFAVQYEKNHKKAVFHLTSKICLKTPSCF